MFVYVGAREICPCGVFRSLNFTSRQKTTIRLVLSHQLQAHTTHVLSNPAKNKYCAVYTKIRKIRKPENPSCGAKNWQHISLSTAVLATLWRNFPFPCRKNMNSCLFRVPSFQKFESLNVPGQILLSCIQHWLQPCLLLDNKS